MRGGGEIFFKKVPISIWELCTSRGGGGSIFQKCPNLNYFAIILQYYLYKKCRKIKIWSEGGGGGGGSNFQKCLKFKKVWNFRWGGGSSLFGNFSQILAFPNVTCSNLALTLKQLNLVKNYWQGCSLSIISSIKERCWKVSL